VTTHIDGTPPWFPNLAEVMDPAPALLDAVATAFEPHVAGLDPDVYFTALHCFALGELMATAFDGTVDEAWHRQAAWVSYATGFWCTRAWRGVWLQLDESMSVPTTETSVADLADELRPKTRVLEAGGGDAALGAMAAQLRVPTFHGAVYGLAYNTSYLIVVGEPPPLGQRPPHLSIEAGYVRAGADRFLDVSYQAALPGWLERAQDASDALAVDDPGALARVVDGDPGSASLATVWRDGFELAPQNWGSDFISGMTQPYYDPFVRWSVLYNFGLEAIARFGVVGAARGDAELARRALAANVVFDGSWGSLVLGTLDGTASLPDVVTT
jgi:hypothetical protein